MQPFLYSEALNKLQNDILKKTNGSAETGEPDRNDWIIIWMALVTVIGLRSKGDEQ